jgi:hypothetical protein
MNTLNRCVKNSLRAFACLALALLAFPSVTPANGGAVRVIVAKSTGFEPASITVLSGRVVLIVHNRTGMPQFPTTLVSPSSIQVAAHALDTSTQANSVDDLTLGTGTYQLTSPGHPHWTCKITVQ